MMLRDRRDRGAIGSPARSGGRAGTLETGPPAATKSAAPDAGHTALPGTLDQEALLGVVSHELRTSVTTTYGGAQLLATRDLPEPRRRALATDVSQEAERLYRIVEDLVVLLRSERGELHSLDEPVAVGRLVVSAVERELGRNPRLQIRYLGASHAAAE
jgi:signal transduction histidine kinase